MHTSGVSVVEKHSRVATYVKDKIWKHLRSKLFFISYKEYIYLGFHFLIFNDLSLERTGDKENLK